MIHRFVFIAAVLVLSSCIDFDAAQRQYCEKNPAACNGGNSADGGNGTDGGNSADGGNATDGGNGTDGGEALGLSDVLSAAGRMTGGSITLQLEMGRATGATRMTGGTYSLTGSAAVQR